MQLISIIVPCYNEEETIPVFYCEISKIANIMKDKINFEFIFVDDGSNDKTLDKLKELSIQDKKIKYVSFSRNFGKEAAILAGLKKGKGDFIAIIDADLQDPPMLLPKMYNEIINNNYDCVAAKRLLLTDKHSAHNFFVKKFYSIINKISKTEIVNGARDYRLMTRQMVNAVLSLSEYNRFSKGIFSWVGFKTKWIEYENIERAAGKTSWSFWKLFLYALDGIMAFSTAPLAIASILGFVLCILSFIFICVIIIKTLIWGDPVGGYPSLVCTVIFMGGIQLFCTGILGQYLSKTYLETKKRPIYITKEEN